MGKKRVAGQVSRERERERSVCVCAVAALAMAARTRSEAVAASTTASERYFQPKGGSDKTSSTRKPDEEAAGGRASCVVRRASSAEDAVKQIKGQTVAAVSGGGVRMEWAGVAWSQSVSVSAEAHRCAVSIDSSACRWACPDRCFGAERSPQMRSTAEWLRYGKGARGAQDAASATRSRRSCRSSGNESFGLRLLSLCNERYLLVLPSRRRQRR